jgi:hypothetical protein
MYANRRRRQKRQSRAEVSTREENPHGRCSDYNGISVFYWAKAAGYTAASVVLKIGYGLRGAPKPSVWALGLTRTGIGLAAGALYGGLWILALSKFDTFEGAGSAVLFYVFLLPIRLAEWILLIWLFLDRGLHLRARMWKYAAFGMICSYVLDAIGVGAAFVLPGGFWVC